MNNKDDDVDKITNRTAIIALNMDKFEKYNPKGKVFKKAIKKALKLATKSGQMCFIELPDEGDDIGTVAPIEDCRTGVHYFLMGGLIRAISVYRYRGNSDGELVWKPK